MASSSSESLSSNEPVDGVRTGPSGAPAPNPSFGAAREWACSWKAELAKENRLESFGIGAHTEVRAFRLAAITTLVYTSGVRFVLSSSWWFVPCWGRLGLQFTNACWMVN